jgi:ATP synthase in type III secretion protein N
VMSGIADAQHLESAGRLREVLATYEAQKDLILIGAYKKGSDPKTDFAISRIDAVNNFLKQATHEQMPAEIAIEKLIQLF